MLADACSAATFAADCANNRLFSSPGVPLGALARFVTSFLTLLAILGDEAIGAPTLAEGGIALLLAGGGEAWRSLTSTSSADEEGGLRGRPTEEFDEFSRRRRRTCAREREREREREKREREG